LIACGKASDRHRKRKGLASQPDKIVLDPCGPIAAEHNATKQLRCSGQPLFKELKSLDFLIERGHDASFAAKPVQTLQK
jgi:hypothetical protein